MTSTYSSVRPPALDLDGWAAVVLVLPLLFIAQLATIGAGLFALACLAYAWTRRDRLASILARRWILVAVPTLALISVVWSDAPAITFRAALQLGLTVLAGLLLSAARNPRSVIRGLTLAFFTYVAVAVVAGGTVAIGVGAGGMAVSGLTDSKNLLGDIASTGAIVAVAGVAISLRSRPGWFALSAATFLLCAYAVLGSRSAGALAGLGLGVSAFACLIALARTPLAVRAWLAGVVVVLFSAAGLFHGWIAMTVMGAAETLFDKDATLTGRTYLWARAGELIAERPGLGRGYYAFWRQGDLDAEGLWRYFGIQGRGGFTFHNTLVEILVGLGWAGVIVIGLAATWALVALLRRFVGQPSAALACWIAILVYQLARTPIETIGVAPFYFSTLLMFAGLGVAFGPAREPRRVAADPRLRPVWAAQPSRLRLRGPTVSEP
jgi:exopolysaccharide production protein ExoQ